MPKPEWVDKGFNCHEISMAGLRGHVGWSSNGYTAEFAGRRSRFGFQDINEAKAAVIGIARKTARQLAEALQEIDDA